MLNTYGFLVKVFKVFEDFQTPIDIITTSEVSVSLTIDNDTHLPEIVEALGQYGSVEVDENQSIICVVGDFMVDKTGSAAQVLNALRDIPVRMISYGGSQNNVSLLVATSDKRLAMNKLNSIMFQNVNEPVYEYA
jgi:aspartate kinase